MGTPNQCICDKRATKREMPSDMPLFTCQTWHHERRSASRGVAHVRALVNCHFRQFGLGHLDSQLLTFFSRCDGWLVCCGHRSAESQTPGCVWGRGCDVCTVVGPHRAGGHPLAVSGGLRDLGAAASGLCVWGRSWS